MGSTAEKKEKPDPPKNAVDREAVTPLLLRVFCSTSRHNSINDYSRGATPENEIQIYTWMDASLKELTGLIKEVNPDARKRGTYFDFSLVFPDLRASQVRYQSREIGTTVAGQKGPDDNKTLHDCRFVIGDFLDIAITPPNSRMDRMDYGRRNFGGGGGGDRFRGGRGGFGDRLGFGDRGSFGDRGGFGDRLGFGDRGGFDRDRDNGRDRSRENARDRSREREKSREKDRDAPRGGRDRSL